MSDSAAPNGAVPFYGLAAALVFAPLFLGTLRPLPLMILELAALVLLGSLWLHWPAPLGGVPRAPGGHADRSRALPLSQPVRIFLLLLFLLPLAQLAPMPTSWWAELPGRAFYAEAMRLAGNVGEGFGWRAISLVPSTTEAAWLTLLPPLAAFLVAMRLDRERLLMLVVVFLSIAAGEALLGLIQFGQSGIGDASALGTYRNRNHLAGLLEMALPVSLALLAAAVGHGRPAHTSGRHGQRKQSVRRWLARLSVTRINQAAAFGALTLAILVGLIFTRSRTGISLAMLGVVLCTLMFSHRLGGRNAYGLIGTITACGIGLAGLIGLVPVWSRFAYTDPFEDWRWAIFNSTVQAIGEFFPLGSGAGTFVEVMRRFHPDSITGVYINRAHNDYLEWLLEFGLLAGVLVGIWLLFYLRQWGRVWKRGEWTPFRFAQSGAGIALLLMMLHTLGDYNLRTPANALFTAFLAGVFFHRSRHQEEHGARPPQPSGEDSQPAPSAFAIPPENQRNPFEV